MKLALSTDFGSLHHWERLVAFARKHEVDRLVFWGDYSTAGFMAPFLFPQYPSWLTDQDRRRRESIRENMSAAAQLTKEAGMEFWYCFQALMIPAPERIQKITPGLFNRHGEPDMAGEAVYRLLEEQIDEVLEIAPDLAGLEMWVMECADIVVSRLKHQSISFDEVCRRLVDTVHEKCLKHGLELSVDLHTAGGHRPLLDGLLAAAQSHSDIIVSADNVIGDFHLHLPFNSHLLRAAVTNPIQVHFDLNGEYWGRNFFPTCALSQYKEHIDEALALGEVCVNGRISTGHDRGSSYFNVLPSHRHLYADGAGLAEGGPLPENIEVSCFNTLGGFNAEFFCRYARHPSVRALDVVREFLDSELGKGLDDLAQVLIEVEPIAARVFYAAQNYFNAQSILPSPHLAHFWALDVQLTIPAGEPFPPHDLDRDGRAEFAGWPVPVGLLATGVHSLIEEKRQALADAESLLDRANLATSGAAPELRSFVLNQFEDFALYARAAAILLEAMAHYFHLREEKACADIPDRDRLAELVAEMKNIAGQWLGRQPNDEWKVASILHEWQAEIARNILPEANG